MGSSTAKASPPVLLERVVELVGSVGSSIVVSVPTVLLDVLLEGRVMTTSSIEGFFSFLHAKKTQQKNNRE